MFLKVLYNINKYMFFQKLVPKNILYPEQGCKDGDIQLRSFGYKSYTVS